MLKITAIPQNAGCHFPNEPDFLTAPASMIDISSTLMSQRYPGSTGQAVSQLTLSGSFVFSNLLPEHQHRVPANSYAGCVQ